MLRKSFPCLVAIVLFGAAFATPARAQSQAVSFNLGYFTIRGSGATVPAPGTTRTAGDVLVAELNGGLYDALAFRLGDFNDVTFGGDYLIGLGDFLEGGVGIGYYRSTVTSVSANFLNPDGSEITQALRLRIVPITATVRFLPLGRHGVVEPYIGGGLGIFNWKYTESGDFVFPNPAFPDNPDIIPATYEAPCSDCNVSAWAAGPVIVGGARVPFSAYAVGFELKWQRASGTLPTTGQNAFLGDKIDLGGISYNVTFGVRF